MKFIQNLSFAFVFAILATTVSAQTNAYDVAKLEKKGPESYPDCVERFAKIFGDNIPKRVFQDCKDLAKDASKTSGQISREESKSKRLQVVYGGGGYGSSYYMGNGLYDDYRRSESSMSTRRVVQSLTTRPTGR